MAIKLSERAKKELSGALTDEGDVKLPFPAPTLWVMNGNAQLKSVGGARYFGGWATGAEEFDAIIDQTGAEIPTTLTKQEFVPKTGEALEVYAGRHVSVAPIGKRLSSTTKDGNRYPGYHKGASPHIQILAYMSWKDNSTQKVMPWGAVVLSAKGYQAGYLLDAFKKWDSITTKARREFCPGVPSNLFYCSVGTFGKEPNSKSVGSGDNKSPITPIELYVPPTIDEKFLDYLFVSEQLADEMANMRTEAKDWMEAWKTAKTEKQPVVGGEEPPPPDERQDDDVPW